MPAKLYSRFPQIAAELPLRTNAVAEHVANLVEEGAKQRVPDRPPIGEGLVEAIHVEPEEPGVFRVVGGDHDHWWGHFLEYGTVKASPRPYMGPAAEAVRDQYLHMATVAIREL